MTPGSEFERIAQAMAEWSLDKPWAERRPKHQRHWLLVAEAVMSNDPVIVSRVAELVQVRKAESPSPLPGDRHE